MLPINHPINIARRNAAVAHLGNVRFPSPAAKMVENSAYHLKGAAAVGASRKPDCHVYEGKQH